MDRGSDSDDSNDKELRKQKKNKEKKNKEEKKERKYIVVSSSEEEEVVTKKNKKEKKRNRDYEDLGTSKKKKDRKSSSDSENNKKSKKNKAKKRDSSEEDSDNEVKQKKKKKSDKEKKKKNKKYRDEDEEKDEDIEEEKVYKNDKPKKRKRENVAPEDQSGNDQNAEVNSGFRSAENLFLKKKDTFIHLEEIKESNGIDKEDKLGLKNLRDSIVDVTIMENYLYMKMNDKRQKAESANEKDSSGVIFEENCAICMNPLYEEIFVEDDDIKDKKKFKKLKEIIKLQEKQYRKGNKRIPCCKLEYCGNHFYHKSCLVDFAKSQIIRNDRYVIRCCICAMQYGDIFGDMPNGIMQWQYSKSKHCEGDNNGSFKVTYIIDNYDASGDKIEKKAYLPGGEKGKKCLAILIRLFMHKFTFCTARSMSNPNTKSVFWGRIFHKTKRDGGGVEGYPDSNYLNDLITACRSLGVSCDDPDEINKLVDENSQVEVISKVDGEEPTKKFKKLITPSHD